MIRFPKPTRAISEGLGIFSKGPDILFLPGEKTILSEGIKLALFYFGNKNFIDSGIIETEKLLIDSSEKLKKGFLNVISNDKITNENLSVPLMPADNTRYVQKPFKSFIKK